MIDKAPDLYKLLQSSDLAIDTSEYSSKISARLISEEINRRQ